MYPTTHTDAYGIMRTESPKLVNRIELEKLIALHLTQADEEGIDLRYEYVRNMLGAKLTMSFSWEDMG